MRSRHIRIDGDTLSLDFVGKGSIDHHLEVTVARLVRTIAEIDRLPGYEVFSYRDDDGVATDVRSGEVNEYIKAHMGEDFSAKDFRTWAGTVAAAVALDELEKIDTSTARRRAVARVSGHGRSAGKHSRGLSRKLHRPARHRPLPRRAHHLGACRRAHRASP
jgi:DNA topoisomerase I